jgi:hypothetical protein
MSHLPGTLDHMDGIPQLGIDMGTNEICALVLEACDLVERHGSTGTADALAERALSDAELLRAELRAALPVCADDVAADVHGAVAELDELLAHLRSLPAEQVALSA